MMSRFAPDPFHGLKRRRSLRGFMDGFNTIGSFIGSLHTGNLFSETTMGNVTEDYLIPAPPQTGTLSTSPTMRLLPFSKITTGNLTGYGYVGTVSIPTGLTMTTGITLYIVTTDDGAIAGDLGGTVVFGAQVRKANGATLVNTYGTATEVTITMSSTSGTTVKTAIAIANANLNSAGAGDNLLIRIYRKGTSTSDTCFGRVLVMPDIRVEDT